jgi:hypothetical protein
LIYPLFFVIQQLLHPTCHQAFLPAVLNMNDQPATLLEADDVRPQSMGIRRQSTRLEEYRQRLRRERNRDKRRRNWRIAIALTAILTIFSSGVAYKAYHPEFTLQHYVSVEFLNVTALDLVLDAIAERAANISLFLTNSTHGSHEEIADHTRRKKETNNTSMESEPVKKAEKKVEKPMPEAEPVTVEKSQADSTHETPIPVALPEPPPVPPKKKELESQKGEIVRVDSSIKKARPIFCNVPLAYIVHPKCRRLASENPIFNLHGLVQDMMQ